MGSSTRTWLICVVFLATLWNSADAKWKKIHVSLQTVAAISDDGVPFNKYHGQQFSMDSDKYCHAISQLRVAPLCSGEPYEEDMSVIPVKYPDAETYRFVNVVRCYTHCSGEFWVKKEDEDFIVLYQ